MPKIALVAMSGVRVKDRDLAEFGLTLPGFVERSEVIASLPSLGLLTLASHVPTVPPSHNSALENRPPIPNISHHEESTI